jgi:hypothetical protein
VVQITAVRLLTTLDRRFWAWAATWAVASLLAFGFVSAIVPNPVFGRQIPPEPFAIAVWLLSAPLMGLVAATYTVTPSRYTAGPDAEVHALDRVPDHLDGRGTKLDGRSSALGTVAGIGAFLAIGCPVCNKIALLLLGTSGALTVFAPLQPAIGVVSLALLVGTLAWRLRLRSTGATCEVDR